MMVHSRQHGFSLTEVLIALGTLAIGMLFVGGTFVLAVHFSVLTTERTYAAAVLQEAQNKVDLALWYADTTVDANFARLQLVDPNGYAYPEDENGLSNKQYTWSALIPKNWIAGDLSQVIFFACRRVDSHRFPDGGDTGGTQVWPVPILTTVKGVNNDPNLITSDDGYLRVGSVFVNDATGIIYHVIGREPTTTPPALRIQPVPNLVEELDGATVWTIPPALGSSGKNPCIGVFSREMRLKSQ